MVGMSAHATQIGLAAQSGIGLQANRRNGVVHLSSWRWRETESGHTSRPETSGPMPENYGGFITNTGSAS